MARTLGMVQVRGTTYRIERARREHAVVRILDDRRVGSFTLQPSLLVLDSRIPHHDLGEIARAALRAGRLPWCAGRTPLASPQPRMASPRRRPRRAVLALARLLLLPWPAL